MTGEGKARLISINEALAESLGRSPHRFYILEMGLGDPVYREFRLNPREVLSRFEELADIDPNTNVHITALDGDKGDLPTEYVKKTHAFVLDFRPLGIEVVYWACVAAYYRKFGIKLGVEAS